MPQQDRLYSIEECEQYVSAKQPGWDHVTRAFKQLADTMRENERLREDLRQITGKLPYGFLHAYPLNAQRY